METYFPQLRSPRDNFRLVCDQSEKKVEGGLLSLFLKAILGGWFAGLGGHAAHVLAASFFTSGEPIKGASKTAFGLIFSSALVCIITTGTDLFTSNTMCISLLLYCRRISFWKYFRTMAISFFGNYCGAVLSALVLTGGTGYFLQGSAAEYMEGVAVFKTSLPFWRVICSAIGCNCYVCIAVWNAFACLDSAGNILSTVLLISSFAVGGYEHIIANFYTMHAAWFSRVGVGLGKIYLTNLLPTFVGNVIAGSCVIGLPLFFLYGQKEAVGGDEGQAGEVVAV